MAGIDEYTNRYFNELPNYKCPACRHPTLIPYYRRPLNQTLNSICQGYPEYDSRRLDVEDFELKEDARVEKDFDIAQLAKSERKRIAINLYDEILPLLVEAARKGSSAIIISCPEKVNSISRVMDIFSKYLFNHKIFRIIATNDEVTISILEQVAMVNNEYVNPELNGSFESRTARSASDYTPSPPPREDFSRYGSQYSNPSLTRISRAVDRLSLSDFRLSHDRVELPELPTIIAPRRLLEEWVKTKIFLKLFFLKLFFLKLFFLKLFFLKLFFFKVVFLFLKLSALVAWTKKNLTWEKK